MNVKTNIKDLPEHNLTIISASDPSFDTMMAILLKGYPGVLIDDLKPSSLFIRNTGNQAVVGLKLKWECMKADGTIITKEVTEASPGVLMDNGALNHQAALEGAATAIKPHSTRFYSLILPSQSLEDTTAKRLYQEDSLKLVKAELALSFAQNSAAMLL